MPELTALLCKGCGAPLPETDDLQLQVTCRFCGVVNERSQAGVPLSHVEIVVDASGPRARNASTAVGRVVAIVVLAIGGSLAWTVWMARTTARTVNVAVSDATNTAATLARLASEAANAKKPLGKADLFPLDGKGGWRTVSVDPPPGGWSRVDPVAAIAWARDIARPWAPDAVLYRVDVKKVGEDGLIDLTSDDAELGFRWVSPGRMEAWRKEADLKGDVEGVYGMLMQVGRREMRVLVERGRPNPTQYPKTSAESTAMPALLARARTQKNWVTKPFYQGYLIRLDDEGWVWYLNSLSGRDSIPRLRAKDGKTYPYR